MLSDKGEQGQFLWCHSQCRSNASPCYRGKQHHTRAQHPQISHSPQPIWHNHSYSTASRRRATWSCCCRRSASLIATFCEQLTAVADDLKAAGLGLLSSASAARCGQTLRGHRGAGGHARRFLSGRAPSSGHHAPAELAGGSRAARYASSSGRCRRGGRRWTAQARRRRVVGYLLMCAGIGAPGTLPEIARAALATRRAGGSAGCCGQSR